MYYFILLFSCRLKVSLYLPIKLYKFILDLCKKFTNWDNPLMSIHRDGTESIVCEE